MECPMQSLFSKALSKTVSDHIELSETRRETLAWLALLVMQHGTICLWRLAIDRTNWCFGRTTINVLMISVMWNGMGVPLIWVLLPSAVNSNTRTRIC